MKKFILSILVLALFGCGEKKDESDAGSNENLLENREGMTLIFPLDLSTEWIYEVGALDTSTSSMRLIKVDTFSLVGDTTIDGVKWFKAKGLGLDDYYAVNWNDGLYYARTGGKPFLFAKYPADVGDTFTSQIGRVEAKTTVAAIGLEIKVPAGTFFCHQYSQTIGEQGMTTNYYLAPGVGLIKMDVLDRVGASPIIENRLIQIKRK